TGQLNGTIIVTTPIGLCDISVSVGGPGSVSTDSTSSANPQASSVRCTRPMRSKVDSPITLPFSAERRAASVSESSITVSTAANNSSALRCGVVPAQSSQASLAAATASSACSVVAAAATPTISVGLAGLVICSVDVVECSRPP